MSHPVIPHHVVILGGAYAGITAMRELSCCPTLTVTLIDQHPYHFLQTEGYELIASNTPFDDTIVSLPALCANYDNVTFKHRRIVSIDSQNKTVHLEHEEVQYDTLIIALGSVTKLFDCAENVYNYSSGAKSLRGALKLNQFFQDELYKRLESNKKAKESFNIIVGGAGLSGVEIAAGMQEFFNRYYTSNSLCCAKLQIHLIASRETVLNGMHPSIIKSATKRLKELSVNVHTKSRLHNIEAHTARLEDGSAIDFDFMIFAGGTTVAPCLRDLGLEQSANGQFVVDAYLRSTEDQNIYIIGDCAALCDKKGKALPPTAQTARQSGRLAAHNVVRASKHKSLKKSDLKIKGIAIALGGKYAVIDLGYLRVDGYVAYLIKKLIERFYKWPLWFLAAKGFKKIDSCEI